MVAIGGYKEISRFSGIQFLTAFSGVFVLMLSTSGALSIIERALWTSLGMIMVFHPIYKSDFVQLNRAEEESENREETGRTSTNRYSKLEELDPDEFELMVSDLWKQKGWNTELTSSTSDKGVDVRATRDKPYERKMLIQAKNYSKDNKVSSEEVQRYASLKDQEEGVDEVLIVTTSSFTSQAEELAEKLNVKMIGRKKLEDMISDSDLKLEE